MASIEGNYDWMAAYRFDIYRTGVVIATLVDNEDPVPYEQLEAAMEALAQEVKEMASTVFRQTDRAGPIMLRGPLLKRVEVDQQGYLRRNGNSISVALYLLKQCNYRFDKEIKNAPQHFQARLMRLNERFHLPCALQIAPHPSVSEAMRQPVGEWQAAQALCECAKKLRVGDKRSRSSMEPDSENEQFIQELQERGIVVVTNSDRPFSREEREALREQLEGAELGQDDIVEITIGERRD